MQRKEFERVTPEEVGISSASVLKLVEQLDGHINESHGIIIMRYGKICAEGWWKPYAAGIHHGQQSQSKAFTATAIGIAYTQGLLSLDERIIDIFPEIAPAQPSENLKKITIHHILSMSGGMDQEPAPITENWLSDFLAKEVTHEPGTSFMYNSTGTTVLASILKKKTGMGLQDFLKTHLFDKIGIDSSHIHWMPMPDGTEFGGGGIFCTLEDTLRLMKIYADNGMWENERILAEDFVKNASTIQIHTGWEALDPNPETNQDHSRYGYQLWMCKPSGVYRADGAFGQYTIVDPNRNMIIAFNQNDTFFDSQNCPIVRKIIWDFLKEIPITDNCSPLEPSDDYAQLVDKLTKLSLPAPKYMPFSPIISTINGNTYRFKDSTIYFSFYSGITLMAGLPKPAPVTSVQFTFSHEACTLTCVDESGRTQVIKADIQGSYHENIFEDSVPNRALASAYWETPDTLALSLRWVEAVDLITYHFHFEGDVLTASFVPIIEASTRTETSLQGKLV